MAIFATVSNLASVVGWQDAKMRLILRKSHIYEDRISYGVAGTLERAEAAILQSGLLVGRSFGALEHRFLPGI